MPKQMNNMRSVRRCFQLMELFDENREPLSATQISKILEAPLSSVIDLLKCLQDLGYMGYDSRDRTYFMTGKIAGLGHWMSEMQVDEESYLSIINELHEETKETIAVFWPNDLQVKCIASIRGSHPLSFNLSVGQSFPVVGSAAGNALIAQWDDKDIKKLVQRNDQVTRKKTDYEGLLEEIELIRARGYATSYDKVVDEVGAVAVARPVMDNQWLVFSIGGSSKRIRQEEDRIVKLLKKI